MEQKMQEQIEGAIFHQEELSKECYEELFNELIESNERYAIIYASFRVKNTDEGDLIIFELFPENCFLLHGKYIDDEHIMDFFDDPIGMKESGLFEQDGCYSGRFLFSICSDSDDYRSWYWLEFNHCELEDFHTNEEQEVFSVDVNSELPF